jgi:hypothetical protein
MKSKTFYREVQKTDLSKENELVEIKSTGRKKGANSKLKRAFKDEKN